MSQKNMRRSRRRTDDDMDPDFKAPQTASPKKDLLGKTEPIAEVNTKNGVDDEAGNLKGFAPKEANDSEGTDANSRPKTRSRSNTPQNKKELKNNDAGDGPEENNKNDNNTEEMEPLVLDVEEHEPELEFDDTSESESHKDSPNSIRCKTRRSQTRNIPTPKTPKSAAVEVELEEINLNGDELQIVSAEPDSNGTDTAEENPNSSNTTEKVEVDDTSTATTVTSLDNLSTKVQVPSDETRNAEITASDEQAIDQSSFLHVAREKSFTEILRRASSRRPIHSNYNPRSWENAAPFNRTVNMSLRPSVERIAGVKRKNRSETPESKKRTKTDATNGFLSYISSPITNIKNRFVKSDVQSSTPKLTGYKDKIFENANVSKIDAELQDTSAEKKWCIIM